MTGLTSLMPWRTLRDRGRSAMFAAAAMFALPLAPSDVTSDAESDRRQLAQHGLSGVIGHWTQRTMGAPSIVVDGEQWSGSTAPADLRAVSQQLFGGADSTMIADWTSPSAFPVAIARNVRDFGSGTVRVRFNMLGGQSDQNAGVLFGLQPAGTYYYIRYNTKDGDVALWQFADGERKVITHGAVRKQLPQNAWHELVVTVRDREVRGMIAGDTTLSVTHTLDSAPRGRVGVWVKRDAITAFQGFTAVAAAPTALPSTLRRQAVVHGDGALGWRHRRAPQRL